MRQLKRQLDDLHSLPGHCAFVNYLRCHDDIGWGLNEDYGRSIGIDPYLHKKYLYEFYDGSFPGSWARGERYNYDPRTGDARSCGTTASLCGIEKGLAEGDAGQVELGIARDLMMHAVIMTMKGFPMLSSGDEVGQLNDYSYHEDADRREDSRNVHRSRFDWAKAERRTQGGTIEQRIWDGLGRLERIRKTERVFEAGAWVSTWDTCNEHVLALVRRHEGRTLVGLFNFTGEEQWVRLESLPGGGYTELVTGERGSYHDRALRPYEYALWLTRD